MPRNQTQFATRSATQWGSWMIFESILLYKNLLKSHRSYDKKWPFGRYSLTVETTSSSFDTRWGGRGRKFKSCHSDQIKPWKHWVFKALFFACYAAFSRGVTQFATQVCVTPLFVFRLVVTFGWHKNLNVVPRPPERSMDKTTRVITHAVFTKPVKIRSVRPLRCSTTNKCSLMEQN